MNIGNKKIVLALAVIAMFAGISLYASLYQDTERSYSPEGAWLMNGVVNGQPFLWMDTYTSNSNNPAVSGTVLCTLPAGNNQTQSGHGNWIRIGKNKFAFTAWRFMTGADGKPVGKAKFWGTVTLDAENQMSGTMNAQYYWLNGAPIGPALSGTSTGTLIEVEVEEQ